MFIYFWETDRAWEGEGQREREVDTESEAGSRLWAVSTEPDAGLELTNREIMTWAKAGRLTDWATQAPQNFIDLKKTAFSFTEDSVNQWQTGEIGLELKSKHINRLRMRINGAPGWLSRLSVQLRLRLWSRGLWVRAPHLALCWQLGA